MMGRTGPVMGRTGPSDGGGQASVMGRTGLSDGGGQASVTGSMGPMTGRPAQEGPWGRARGNDTGEGRQDQGVGPACPHGYSSPASLGQACPLLPDATAESPPPSTAHSSIRTVTPSGRLTW